MASRLRSSNNHFKYAVAMFAGIAALCLTATAGTQVNNPTGSHDYLLMPNGGNIFHVGDTIQIQVQSTDPTNFNPGHLAGIELSVDNGATPYYPPTGGPTTISASTAAYTMVIPDTLRDHFQGNISPVSTQCRIKITDYSLDGVNWDASDNTFTILPKSTNSARVSKNGTGSIQRNLIMRLTTDNHLEIMQGMSGSESANLTIMSVAGQKIAEISLNKSTGSQIIAMPKLANGSYIARLTGGTTSQAMPILIKQ